jgi:glutamyl-tRNA synthetase
LLAEGKAYRDFTPKEETGDKTVKQAIVERARSAEKDHRANPYRDLSTIESDTRAANGEPYAIRLKVAETGKTSFEDGVYGLQERDYSDTEDLVLLRSDGHPLYNLAVVCDDIEMGITHVIRGQDHLTNTHKQILIYEALGVTPPKFAHLPLILAPNKGKLSKRKHGEVVSLTTYRDNGFVPAAFRNFLALLGWSAGEEKDIYSLDEMIEKFSLDHIHRSNAIFNFHENDPRHWTDDKALWMNAEYIRTMPLAELLPLVKAELKAAKLWREEYEESPVKSTTPASQSLGHPSLDKEGRAADSPPVLGGVAPASGDGVVQYAAGLTASNQTFDREWYEKTVELIRHRFFTLKDFSSQGRAYFSEDYDFEPAAVAKNLTKFPDLREWLPQLADRFEAMDHPFDEAHIETVVKAFTEEKGTKLGVIMNGARTLLTGVAVGPSMLSVFETLGKDRTITRLKSQLAWN